MPARRVYASTRSRASARPQIPTTLAVTAMMRHEIARAVQLPPVTVLGALASLATLLASAVPARAQTVVGRAVVAGGDEPATGAVVVAFDAAFERRAQTIVDTAGAFVLQLPDPGEYRLQAGFRGNYGPLSEVLEVGAGAEVGGVMLEIASPLAALAATCPAEMQGEGRAAVVGVVYARGSAVALPMTWVTLSWDSAAVPAGAARGAVARTDGAGRYRACGVQVGVPVSAAVEALGAERGALAFSVPAAPWARADLEVEMGLGTSGLAVTGRTPQPELGEESALSGRVVDAQSGEALSGVAVMVDGRTEVTDGAGAFRLEGLEAGPTVVALEYIGYGTQREALDLDAGVESVVRVTLAPRPIALEGIEVEGRRGRGLFAPRSSIARASTNVIAGEFIEEARERGATVVSLVRARFPALTVKALRSRDGILYGYCIESTRRIARLIDPARVGEDGVTADCVPVIVNGARIGNGWEYLRALRVDAIESIEFVSSTDAAILYGPEAGAAGGALVLWTRGKGPHANRWPRRE